MGQVCHSDNAKQLARHVRRLSGYEEDDFSIMTISLVVFTSVYLGMALGRIPGLALDRTGIALLGLIALIATKTLKLTEAAAAIDTPTLALLFALMVVSAQFERSGFYAWLGPSITAASISPKALLLVVILVSAAFSSFLTNDVVVFALTPLLCAGLLARQLNPTPYLLALATGANAGSAATLIGNPQNILIGQAGQLDFWRYSMLALPPTVAVLGIIYGVIVRTWHLGPLKPNPSAVPVMPVDRSQLAKASLAVAALVLMFLTPFPREVSALAVAGVLLLSRRLSSRDMLGAVDWHLLLLFACLFGITEAFSQSGVAQEGLLWLGDRGLNPQRISLMAPLALVASNTIGNVPFVVLFIKLFPGLGAGPLFGLAMLSTFAGNFLLTGSMCNIIVAERAALQGARLSFIDFARSGIPIGLLSVATTTTWLLAIKLSVF
jgi:Na+/H+ antiporter NhaD/arsenite permease-like protein